MPHPVLRAPAEEAPRISLTLRAIKLFPSFGRGRCSLAGTLGWSRKSTQLAADSRLGRQVIAYLSLAGAALPAS